MHFTKRDLEAIRPPAAGRALYHDSTRGLLLKVETSGRKTFAWYRKIRGTPTWKSIGTFPEIDIETARQHASQFNVAAARWKAAGYPEPNPFERPRSDTFNALIDEYVTSHLLHHSKRPQEAEKNLRWKMKRYFPQFSTRKLSDIRHEEVAKLHRAIGARYGRRTANHCVQTLRTLYGFARRTRIWNGENPGADHVMFDEVERERFLNAEELGKLWTALKVASPDTQDFINLALFTAARKMDVLSMKWSDVILEGDNPQWRVPYTTKSGVPYTIPLVPEAREILLARFNRREDENNPWVFPGSGKSGHVMDMKSRWRELLKEAGLEFKDNPEQRPRIHDLRRTAGSFMAGSGESLLIVGRALGHADPASTKVYARIDTSAVRAALETSGSAIYRAMRTKPKKPAARQKPKLLTAGKKAQHG